MIDALSPNEAPSTKDLGPRDRMRWVILGLLTCFSTVSYVERINLTVAARFIRDAFRLSDSQIGWSFSVFLISYTLAQLPAGALIDRYGPRRILAIAGGLWFVITVLIGIFVGRLATTGVQVMSSLILGRLLLGLVEAPTYVGAASAIARWFPSSARGVPNAIIQATSFGGEALTLILMASLTAYLGWRNALFASALPALLIALAWWRWGADRPDCDPRVSDAELSYIRYRLARDVPVIQAAGRLQLLRNPKLIVLSASYFFHGYVTYLFFFWFYIYLVDDRHFTIAAGGIVGALPTIAAALCTFIGGYLSDLVARRAGPIVGRRRLIVAAGLSGAVFLIIGAYAPIVWLAVAGFVSAVGTRGLVEASFWSIVNDFGGENSGFVGGAMNGLGNLGGVVSTVLAPALVTMAGWSLAMSVAAAASALSGLWLFGISVAKRPALTRSTPHGFDL